MRFASWLAAALVAAAATGAWGALGGCAPAGPDGWGETTGTASADLSATGPDGATYALPATATITFAQAGGSTTTMLLEQGVDRQTFYLPAGSYSVTLAQNGDAGSTWALLRHSDGGATSVNAVLMDPMPISITVAQGQVTPLVFHFDTDTLGPVVFGTGQVDAGIALDAGAFPMSDGAVSGTATMTVEMLNGPTNLNNALRFNAGVALTYKLNLTRSGNWAFAADQACAPVKATTSASSSLTALADLVLETTNGAGTLCFGDRNLSGQFLVHLARTGAPTTPLLKTDLPDGGTFEVSLTGLAPIVFDGGTLSLGSLPEPFTAKAVDFSTTVSQQGTVIENVSTAPSGTASVTLHR